jgi:hypothetical protein
MHKMFIIVKSVILITNRTVKNKRTTGTKKNPQGCEFLTSYVINYGQDHLTMIIKIIINK